VESDEFKDLLQFCRPSIKLPGRTQLKSLITERASQVRRQILQELPKDRKLSLAVDCWSSPNHLAFFAILGYFITNDWEYKEVLLAYHPLHGKHSGKSLANLVAQTLREYEVHDRLLALTADNASNNDTLRKELARELLKDGVTWNKDAGTIRCMAHVIQLAVNRFLGTLKSVAKNDTVDRHLSESRLAKIDTKTISFRNTFAKVWMSLFTIMDEVSNIYRFVLLPLQLTRLLNN
jgi:hypothetical protein